MADGNAALEEIIARIREMGASIQGDAAKEARPLVEAEAKRTAAAGTDPYGNPWLPKKDGARAMPDTPNAIRVNSAGAAVVTKVLRGAAIQDKLSKQGGPRLVSTRARAGRLVIPSGDLPLPAGYVDALREGATRAFRKLKAQ